MFIVVLCIAIVLILIYRNKRKKKFLETPQYQIYLKALEALKQSGYEIKETNSKHAFIWESSKKIGHLFVVEYPGFFSSIPIFGDFSDFNSMKKVCEMVINNRHKSAVYWPSNSLVGGFTCSQGVFQYEDDWLKILASVIEET